MCLIDDCMLWHVLTLHIISPTAVYVYSHVGVTVDQVLAYWLFLKPTQQARDKWRELGRTEEWGHILKDLLLDLHGNNHKVNTR